MSNPRFRLAIAVTLVCSTELLAQTCQYHWQCSDGIDCTNDYCAGSQCYHEPDNTACDDGQYCTGEETCDLNQGCLPGTFPCGLYRRYCNEAQDRCDQCRTNTDCNDGHPCTQNLCNTTYGDCYYPHVTCNDNNACTNDAQTWDYFNSSPPCCSFTPKNCSDNNACTTDSCNPSTGCTYATVTCNDNNACTTDSCNPTAGCVYTAITCTDGNACTADTCNTVTGCAYPAVNCNDGLFCNGVEGCNTATGCTAGVNQCAGQMCDEGTDTCFQCTTTGPPTRNAIRFDGRDDYVRVGSPPALEMTDYFTVEAWVLPQHNTTGIIVNKENEYEIARFPDGKIYWAVNNNAPGWTWVNTGGVAPLNQWTHVAWTFNYPTTQKIKTYINGVLVHDVYGAGPVRNTAAPTDEFRIGGRLAVSNPFAGVIDEVRIWNVERTAAQIQQNMNVVLPGTTAGLKGYWRFEEGSGTTTVDAASANLGTLTGASWTMTGCDDFRACNGPETCGANRLCQGGAPLCPGKLCDENTDQCRNCFAGGPATRHGLRLDGRDDYLRVANGAALEMTTALSLEAWIMPMGPGANGNAVIVSKEGEYLFARYSDGKLWYALNNTSPGFTWVATSASVPINAWSHVVLTYNGSQARIYVNGTLAYSAAATGPLANAAAPNDEFRIGVRQAGTPFFYGVMDNVRVWNTALDDDTVENLAANGVIDPMLAGNLKGWWKFDEGTGTTTSDSASGATATIMGAQWITAGCADDVFCTIDACNSAADHCTHTPDDAACDDEIPCTRDECDEAADGYCTHVPENGRCDDGIGCNGVEVCDPLLNCLPGVEGCDDGLECTADHCDAEGDKCVHVPDDARCDDGIPCTIDLCDDFSDERCAHRPEHSLCDDGVFCNGHEMCIADQGCVPLEICRYGCNEEVGRCEASPTEEAYLLYLWDSLWDHPYTPDCAVSVEPTLSGSRWEITAWCGDQVVGTGEITNGLATTLDPAWLGTSVFGEFVYGPVELLEGILVTPSFSQCNVGGLLALTAESPDGLAFTPQSPAALEVLKAGITPGNGSCGSELDHLTCSQLGRDCCVEATTLPNPLLPQFPRDIFLQIINDPPGGDHSQRFCTHFTDPCELKHCECLADAYEGTSADYQCISSLLQFYLSCRQRKPTLECILDAIDWVATCSTPGPVRAYTLCVENEVKKCFCDHEFVGCDSYHWIHYKVEGLQAQEETTVRAYCKAATPEGEMTPIATARVTDTLHSGCILCRCPHGTEYHVEIDDPSGPGEPKRCAVKGETPPNHLNNEYVGVAVQDVTAEFKCGCIPPDNEFGELIECNRKLEVFVRDLCPHENVEIHASTTHDTGGFNNHSHTFTRSLEEVVFTQLNMQAGDKLQINIEVPQGPNGEPHNTRECVFVGGPGNQTPNMTIENIEGDWHQSVHCREKNSAPASCEGPRVRVHLSGPEFMGRIHIVLASEGYHDDISGFKGQTIEFRPMLENTPFSLDGIVIYNSNVRCCFHENPPGSPNCNHIDAMIEESDISYSFVCECIDPNQDQDLCPPKLTDPRDEEGQILDPWPPRNIPCSFIFPCDYPCSDGIWTWNCPPGGGGGGTREVPCPPDICPPGTTPGCTPVGDLLPCCCEEIDVTAPPCDFICGNPFYYGASYSASTSLSAIAPSDGVDGNSIRVDDELRLTGTASDPQKIAGFLIYLDGGIEPIHVTPGENTTTASLGTVTIDTTQLAEGAHDLHIVTFDALTGAQVPTVSHIPFQVDHTSQPPEPCTLDQSPPTVSVTQPTGGTMQPGSVQIRAHAADDRRIDRVEFMVDGVWIDTDRNAPFKADWNATTGPHTLTAKAFDGCKPGVLSAPVTVNVQSGSPCSTDTTGPTVYIASPASGSTFPGGPVDFVAYADDPSGVDHVNFFFSGQFGSADNEYPFEATRWYSTPGTFQMHARAFDECGNLTIGPPIVVHIQQGGAPCDYDGNDPSGQVVFPPSGGSVVHGPITVVANVQDDLGIFAVAFEIDGNVPADAVDLYSPYQYTFVATTGWHSVRVHVLDLCENDSWSSMVTFNATNRQPVAVNDTATTRRNIAVFINAVVNDYDPDGDSLQLAVTNPFPGTQPAHGTIERHDADTIKYTPAQGYTGPDAFQYRIADFNGGLHVGTVSVTVTP